jgi:hypothetical protein
MEGVDAVADRWRRGHEVSILIAGGTGVGRCFGWHPRKRWRWRGDVRLEIGGLRKEMHEGFAASNRCLDQIIQMQLDQHAARIKKLKTAVFSK